MTKYDFLSTNTLLEEIRAAPSLKASSNSLNIPYSSFLYILESRNLSFSEDVIEAKKRGVTLSADSRRKYPFIEIKDTEFFWYSVGFLLGDGCLRPRENSIRWSNTNKNVLDSINKGLGADRPLQSQKLSSGKNAYTLEISDRYLYKHLIKIGVPCNKGTNREYLVIPKDGFEFPFFRGLLDSDGCVYTGNRHQVYWISSKPQLIWLNHFFNENLGVGIKNVNLCKRDGLYWLSYFGREMFTILNEIYPKNTQISLEPKKEKFLEIVGFYS